MKNDSIVNINFLNWESELNQGLVLLDFWAPWCTACNAQDKIYQHISKSFKGLLKIGKIDISDNRFLAEKFGVKNIPFLILLKNGENVFHMSGIENKDYLISQINKQLI